MCEEPATGVSIYTMISSWLTPSYLFIFINLVIGTIAITSRFANNDTNKQSQLLHRSPSLLNRVMSFNLRYYKHEPTVDPVQSHDSTGLDRVPSSSLLDRIISSEDKDENTKNRIPSLSLLDRVMSSNDKDKKTETPKPDLDDPNQQQQLTRAPSFLERLKSLTLFRSESVKEPEPEPESEVTGSAEETEEEEGVDAKADDFINKFRKQLRLQRLESILRYRDMLKRY